MKRLHQVAGFTILGLWGLAILDGMVTGDYHALDLTTPVMLVLAGYLFGDALLNRGRNGNGNGNGH